MKKLLLILFLAPSSLLAQETDRFALMRESYDREIERVTRPTTRKYVAALKELKVVYTKAGNLEQAVKVQAEIDRLTKPSNSPISAPEQSFAEWVKTVALHAPTKWYSVSDEVVIVHAGQGKQFKNRIVEIDEKRREVIFAFSTGSKVTLKTDPNRKTGELIEASGKNIPLTIKPLESKN